MMKTNVVILAIFSLIFLGGCTKEDNNAGEEGNDDEANTELRGCTEWYYDGNFRSNQFDASIQNYLPAVRSRICEISNTDTTVTVNVMIEPANGGIRLYFGDDNYNGIEINFYGGEQIILSKNDFNQGGVIERTITADIATLDSYSYDNWSLSLTYDFVTAVRTQESSEATVQELINMGVSLNDIRDVYGYTYRDIIGNRYVDGIITSLSVINNNTEITGVTIMAPEDHPQEMNWDDANTMFPDSFYSGTGVWSIPHANDFDSVIAHFTAGLNPHSSWVRPDGGYWLPGSSGGEFDAYGDAYGFSGGDGIRTQALKGTLLKVRLIKKFDL